jgi:decaprenylphospho-beta-D-erythro-pentofuranosid-2-ulose 2-reductase
VTILVQGLRNRLFRDGVSVLTIKPGFVDTPMTKDFCEGSALGLARADRSGIEVAIDKRRNVVYLPLW